MKKLFKSKIVQTILVLIVVVVLAGVWLFAQLPNPGAAYIELGPNASGIYAKASYAWIIYTENGVILIDTGMDQSGSIISEVLQNKGLSVDDVHTILLTHGHTDHWAGVGAFPQARILIGPGEAVMIRGEYQPKGIMAQILANVSPKIDLPSNTIEELPGDGSITIDGEEFQVICLPGHTPGCVAYLWKDILFCGDSIRNSEDGIDISPAIFSDDTAQNRESLKKLFDYEFNRAADGHTGVIENAKEKITVFLSQE